MDFNITSIQNDLSEIVLSSGQICLDLLQTQETGSHKGNIDKLQIKKQSHKSFSQSLSSNLSFILLSSAFLLQGRSWLFG